MSGLNTKAVLAGFVLALALTLVGFVINLPAIGLFGGIAAGSFVAARRAEARGMIQGAGVSVLTLIAVIVMLAIGRQTFPSMDSVNSTSLTWAAAVLLLGPAVGLATRR